MAEKRAETHAAVQRLTPLFTNRTPYGFNSVLMRVHMNCGGDASLAARSSILAGHFLGILRKLKSINEFLDISVEYVIQVIYG